MGEMFLTRRWLEAAPCTFLDTCVRRVSGARKYPHYLFVEGIIPNNILRMDNQYGAPVSPGHTKHDSMFFYSFVLSFFKL